MPGSAPAITHVSHPSLITLCLSFNFDLVICLMALHDSFPSSAPVSLVCRCDSITSHPYILLSLSLSKSLSCHLTFSDRHDLSLNTSSMFLLMFLGMAVCCYVARRSMVRMFESEDRTGRKVLCSPIPHVSPWEHSNTPYCCPSVLFLVIKGRTFPLSIVSPLDSLSSCCGIPRPGSVLYALEWIPSPLEAVSSENFHPTTTTTSWLCLNISLNVSYALRPFP